MDGILAEVELQGSVGGWSAVVKNPKTGYCIVLDLDSDQVESFENVFGEEVYE